MVKRLFSEFDLGGVLENQIAKARKEIDASEEDYLLNVSENDFVKHLLSEYTKAYYKRELKEVRSCLKNVEAQCNAFSLSLEGRIRSIVIARKDRLSKNRRAGLNIGLPLQRHAGAPQTYAVPDIKLKPQIQRPIVKEKGFVPEPALAEQEYENILSIIRSMVSVMERSPKAFAHMGEEEPRTRLKPDTPGR